MEFQSSQQRELVTHILLQIKKAILDLKDWNKDVKSMDELMTSAEGMQRLAGNCMLIQAIGEGFKQVDKRTNGELLKLRNDIPWRQIIGMRDRISDRVVWKILTVNIEDSRFFDRTEDSPIGPRKKLHDMFGCMKYCL